MAHNKYKDTRRKVKRVVRRAKRVPDARSGRRFGKQIMQHKKMSWNDVYGVKNRESRREKKVNVLNGLMPIEGNAVRIS